MSTALRGRFPSYTYLIAPDGGEAKRLTSVAHGCAALKWFPDGKRIAFVSAVWPDLASDADQVKRRKEKKDAKVKAHVTEHGGNNPVPEQ